MARKSTITKSHTATNSPDEGAPGAAPDAEAHGPSALDAPGSVTADQAPGEPEAEAENAALSVHTLIVTSRRDGFRRAGRAWYREPTEVSVDELTDEQVEALYAEPMLQVVGLAQQESKE